MERGNFVGNYLSFFLKHFQSPPSCTATLKNPDWLIERPLVEKSKLSCFHIAVIKDTQINALPAQGSAIIYRSLERGWRILAMSRYNSCSPHKALKQYFDSPPPTSLPYMQLIGNQLSIVLLYTILTTTDPSLYCPPPPKINRVTPPPLHDWSLSS